jgi:hypothetical protein
MTDNDWGNAKGKLNERISKLRHVHEKLPSIHSNSVIGWDLDSAHIACFHIQVAIESLERLTKLHLKKDRGTMTDQQHPITPPPELVQQWFRLPLSTAEILVIAAQWGYQQAIEELEAFLKKDHDKD